MYNIYLLLMSTSPSRDSTACGGRALLSLVVERVVELLVTVLSEWVTLEVGIRLLIEHNEVHALLRTERADDDQNDTADDDDRNDTARNRQRSAEAARLTATVVS